MAAIDVQAFEAAARRGMGLLQQVAVNDFEHGSSWREMLDEEMLDMSLEGRCVLGQAFGGYEYGLDILGLEKNQAEYYGFSIPYGDDWGHSDKEYDEAWGQFTQVWKALLKEEV